MFISKKKYKAIVEARDTYKALLNHFRDEQVCVPGKDILKVSAVVDGEKYELDPCLYQEVETIDNCTVRILKCVRCGKEEIEWFRN